MSPFKCLKAVSFVVSIFITSSVAGFFGRSEGSAIMTTTCVSFFALVVVLFLFRIYSFRLKGPLKGILYLFLVFSIAFVGSLIRIKVIHLLGGQALPLLGLEPILWYVVVGGALPSTGPNGAESSSTWEESEFEMDVLGESFSSSKTDTDSPPAEASQTEEGEPSVNQEGPQKAGPALPTNPVPSGGDEAGPVVPYPYRRDEMIGGDSVEAIERRLLAKHPEPNPPAEIIKMARIEAEDLFEIKAKIIQRMALYDPAGDWMGRGARALDNPRTTSGEERLERLYDIWEDLHETGPLSDEFSRLQEKVFRKKGGPGGDSIA